MRIMVNEIPKSAGDCIFAVKSYGKNIVCELTKGKLCDKVCPLSYGEICDKLAEIGGDESE
ncbi:MAG: hypothetical protein ACI4WY_04740 [Anaerovoracaceae bacterium]